MAFQHLRGIDDGTQATSIGPGIPALEEVLSGTRVSQVPGLRKCSSMPHAPVFKESSRIFLSSRRSCRESFFHAYEPEMLGSLKSFIAFLFQCLVFTATDFIDRFVQVLADMKLVRHDFGLRSLLARAGDERMPISAATARIRCR